MDKPDIPSWDGAPAWAAYVAQNRDGAWYWFEDAPDLFVYTGVWKSTGRHAPVLTSLMWCEAREFAALSQG